MFRLRSNSTAGVLATAVSGLSNLVVQLVVAALTSAEQFGLFAIASATIILLLGVGRAVIGQTDVLRGAGDQDRAPVAAAFLIAIATVFLGIVLWAIGAVIENDIVAIIGVAVALSSVFILQDGARFRCFRMQQSHIALTSDSVVLVAAVIGLFIASRAGVAAETALGVWAGATGLGLLAVIVHLQYWPSRSGWKWIVDHRDLIVPGLGEYSLQAGVPYVLNWLIIALGGLQSLAGYRLIQLLFAAVSNLAQGLNAVTLPAVVSSMDPALARRALMREGVTVVAASLLIFFALLLVPDAWGAALFGLNWFEVGPFLLAGSIHGLVNALAVPNFSMLRLLGFANFSFFVRLGSSAASIMLAVIGGALMGAVGVAWGLAIAAGVAYIVRAYKCRTELKWLMDHGTPIRATVADRGQQV